MSKLIPILFSTPMVQAILGGNKTMTRRSIKLQPSEKATEVLPTSGWGLKHFAARFECLNKNGKVFYEITNLYKCPYGKVGDILWVRETFIDESDFGESPNYVYKADCENYPMTSGSHWKPSIFMPKEACRIFLKITSIRVERLHDINEVDAIAEGVSLSESGKFYLNYTDERSKVTQFIYNLRTAKESFKTLWTLINGFRDEPYAWFKNPFVWVIEFKQIEKPTL